MAGSSRLIRRRIKSVGNTKKITKAMELVSAAKMRKAVAAAQAGKPYADAARRAVAEIATATDPAAHALFRAGSGSRDLVIVFASDRGLCGASNGKLLGELGRFLNGRNADLATAGKKAQQWAVKRGNNLVASWPAFSNNPSINDLQPIAQLAVKDFLAGKYRSVHLAYNDFKSALTQTPVVRQLLPLHEKIQPLKNTDQLVHQQNNDFEDDYQKPEQHESRYLFEPSATAVLNTVLPRLVEALIWQAALEAAASEHSSRMLAMRAATDNAVEMIADLTLVYNQARQSGITSEIAEIAAGAAAIAS